MRVLHLLLLFSTTLVDVGADERWFDRHSEGWFWYEPLDDESAGEDSPQPMKITPQQSLSAAWIRQNISQYLDRAIDEPSKENVSNYLYLDRMVKEKGEQFARVGKQVIESDPMLDENVRRPISPAAAKIKDDMAHQAKEEILRKVAKIAGLVFYYRGNCKLCHLQAQSVQLMKEYYGFELISFSTDGVLIPNLPGTRIERSPPQRLNILAYPALFLMQPPDSIALLRQGGISFIDLTERILLMAVDQGWITQREFNETRVNYETWNHWSAVQQKNHRSPTVVPKSLHLKKTSFLPTE